jgi:hypothetical protein
MFLGCLEGMTLDSGGHLVRFLARICILPNVGVPKDGFGWLTTLDDFRHWLALVPRPATGDENQLHETGAKAARSNQAKARSDQGVGGRKKDFPDTGRLVHAATGAAFNCSPRLLPTTRGASPATPAGGR